MRSPFLALTLLAPIAFAQTPMDKTMVVVNGQSVTAKTYYRRMELLPSVGQVVNNKFVQATPGYLTLSKIVDETLMLQLAKDKGVAPTDAEIDAMVKEKTTENPDLLPGMSKLGLSIDDLKYDIRVQLSEYKVQTMGINITDMEIEKFYKENQETYTLPKRYRLRVIAVDTNDQKVAVDTALNSGKTFGQVAKEHSIDITKGNEGEMEEIPEVALQGTTQAAVKSTKKGSMTDWLSNGEVFVKFFVDDILDPKIVPLDAVLKATIRRNLMYTRGVNKNDVRKMMTNMRSQAKIEFQGTIFDEQLKRGFGKG